MVTRRVDERFDIFEGVGPVVSDELDAGTAPGELTAQIAHHLDLAVAAATVNGMFDAKGVGAGRFFEAREDVGGGGDGAGGFGTDHAVHVEV